MDLDKNDYTVRIKPMLDIKGRWTGQIDMSIVTQPGNDLSDDDYYSLMHFVKMICSSVRAKLFFDNSQLFKVFC